ncbi:MAG: hypothetical protein IJ565_01705 [Bacilli bacterium]|nr:hypothetical protein [Bacilli bacterium]
MRILENYIEKHYLINNQYNHFKIVKEPLSENPLSQEENLIRARFYTRVAELTVDGLVHENNENYSNYIYFGQRENTEEYLEKSAKKENLENLKKFFAGAKYLSVNSLGDCYAMKPSDAIYDELIKNVETRHYIEKKYIDKTKKVEEIYDDNLDLSDDGLIGYRLFDSKYISFNGKSYLIENLDVTYWVYFGKRLSYQEVISLSKDYSKYDKVLEIMKKFNIKDVCEVADGKYFPLTSIDKTYDEQKEQNKLLKI